MNPISDSLRKLPAKTTHVCFCLAFLLLACQHKSVPHTKVEPPGKPLENTYWKLVQLSGITGNLPNTKKDLYLQMKNGIVNGFSGCNNFFGSYSFQNDSLHFESMVATKMFCSKTMDLENNLLGTLAETNLYHISSNELELLHNQVPLAVFVAVAGK
jgi:heat shock protein HslJ